MKRVIGRIGRRLLRWAEPDAKTESAYVDWLRGRGCRIGERVNLVPGCIVDDNHCWHIEIEDDVVIAPRVYILAHDASTWLHLGRTRLAPVIIRSKVFIGAGSIILPGVTIGYSSIVGAGSVVTRSVPAETVVAGNPARVVCSLESFLSIRSAEAVGCHEFGAEFTVEGGIDDERKKALKEDVLGRGYGYVL